MKKNIIFNILIALISIVTISLVTIFCFPKQIPLHFNIYGQIDSLCSKWIFLVSIIPILAFLLLYIFSKHEYLKKFFKYIFNITIFEIILIAIYYSLETEFLLYSTTKLPLPIISILPISVYIVIWANLLKITPYKSKFGLKSKYSLETEFLWYQIHDIAKNRFFIAGFISMLLSLIFSIFNNFLASVISLFICLIIAGISTQCSAKTIWKKYKEMDIRKKNIEKQKEKK